MFYLYRPPRHAIWRKFCLNYSDNEHWAVECDLDSKPPKYYSINYKDTDVPVGSPYRILMNCLDPNKKNWKMEGDIGVEIDVQG